MLVALFYITTKSAYNGYSSRSSAAASQNASAATCSSLALTLPESVYKSSLLSCDN